jgi:uncharacterized protein with PIN domain
MAAPGGPQFRRLLHVLAKTTGEPLRFKGNWFSQTYIKCAV